MSLDFDALRRANVKRCNVVFHPVDAWTPAEWAVAAAGEVGEMCNLVKKHRRLECGLRQPGDPATLDECVYAIGLEMADAITYMDLLAAKLGIDLGLMVVTKFNAVSEKVGSPIRLKG